MKKLLNFVLLLTLTALFMPVLTVGFALETQNEVPQEVFEPDAIVTENRLIEEKAPSYDENTTIRLCHQGTVQELSLKTYIMGVLAAEMPAGFPEEALRAQAVAARTYTMYKQKLYQGDDAPKEHKGADLCDDPAHCEAYVDLEQKAEALWGDSHEVYRMRIQAAVEATDGMILVYEEEPIAAVFCAASSEKTESAGDIWGSALPYLVSVDSPGGTDCSQYEGSVTVSQKDFIKTIQGKWPDADFSEPPSAWFRDSHRTEAGSVVDVLVGGVRVSGSDVRQALGLNSANFKVRVDGGNLVFTTIGYGHGVGLSQYGARYMAIAGQTYDQILQHYYPGTQLQLQG